MLPIKSNYNAIAIIGGDGDVLSGLLGVILVCEKVILENRNYFMLF